MSAFDFDLFVIGGGSGGVRAARIAAQSGARVAIAEEHRYGGTCVIRGCVPKKLFVYASEYGEEIAEAASYGWTTGPVSFDWKTLVANKDQEIDRLNQIYISMLDKAAVKIFHGRAVLADAHTLEVAGERITARIILVATGSRPRRSGIPGVEHIITSDEAFYLPSFPRRVLLAGGGYISIEFAHIFRGMGAEVSLVHRGDQVLGGFDDDVRATVAEGFRSRGMPMHLNTVIDAVEKQPDGTLRATLANGEVLEADVIMGSIGRVPNTGDMGLEAAGVALDEQGAVIVDQLSCTNVDNIYAVGDCTNRLNLTPVAIREGQAFADTVFGNHPVRVDYEHVPTAVFAQPPVGVVGLTEAQARAQLGEVDIYKSTFRPMRHTMSGREQRIMMKMVVDAKTQRVVGFHMVGRDAPEIIQCTAIAVRMGATKDDFDATVAVHPTTAEELVLMRQKV